MGPLIDIGFNLTHDSYDRDRDEVIASALGAGVTRMIVTGTSVTASARAIELCTSHPGTLFATAGIHPHHASQFDAHSQTALHELLQNDCVIAAGECGLDFFRNFSTRDEQLRAFQAQLELAADTRLPVFLHQRDAHQDMLESLEVYRASLTGGVAHCFTGDSAEMAAYIELDLYIGITGWICDERRGEALREAVTRLPLDRLLIETDAPYLLPRDLEPMPKNRRNEPKYLPHIAARIAAIMDRPVADIVTAATANTVRLFSLPETAPSG